MTPRVTASGFGFAKAHPGINKIECLKPYGWPDLWLSGPVFDTGCVGSFR